MSYNERLAEANESLRGILKWTQELPGYKLTDEDRQQIAAIVIDDLGGRPVYGYVEEATKAVVLMNAPRGEYKFYIEMEDGTRVLIGDAEEDNNAYFSITNNLTNCTSSNSATQAVGGESYTATITANSGYELKSVVVTMGSSAVTVNGGVIDIAEVTGNIVITAVAVEAVTPAYKNWLPLAVDTDGSPYNGGKGYKAGYKMSGSSGGESATAGAYCSGFIPIESNSDEIYIKNITLHSGANVNNIVFYDAGKNRVYGASGPTAGQFNAGVLYENGCYHFAANAWTSTQCAFFRFSCGGITDETIVTINEEIV